MRRQPDPVMDPYRTLGLKPGASMADVKRAYRRLAKAYHPDSAGEVALPRFLAINEAYEFLRTGRAPSGARGAGSGQASRPSSAEPWRADPERARAARERARESRRRWSAAGSPGGAATEGAAAGGGTPGRTSGAGASANGTGRTSGGAGSAPGTTGATSSTSGAAGDRSARSGPGGASTSTGSTRGTPPPGSRGPRRRDQRKATLGSTSYDEVRDGIDPTWSGASWYGPTTGEYWIINPREYADPRKHGPEYQSRARRRAAGEDPGDAAEPSGSVESPDAAATPPPAGTESRDPGFEGIDDAVDPEAAAAPTQGNGQAASGRGAGPARDAGTPFDAWSGAARRTSWEASLDEAARRRGQGARRDASRWAGRAATASGSGAWSGAHEAPAEGSFPESLSNLTRAWLGGAGDDPIRRLGLALLAWPPIGLAAAAVIGDRTGCTSFSAACTGTDPLLPWLAQAGILGLLLLLPPLARVLAGGSIAIVLALAPVTAFLLVVGGAGEPEAGFALWTLLAIAWLFGVAWSITWSRRRVARAGP